jgi:hypothetical protein
VWHLLRWSFGKGPRQGTSWCPESSDQHERQVVTSILTILLLSVADCSRHATVAPEGLFFPTVPRQDGYPAGILPPGATLEERSGCLFAVTSAERYLLLWPAGYTARQVEGGIEVLDEDEVRIGKVGEPLTVGGGGVAPAAVGGAGAAHEWATGLTGGEIPVRCGDTYWIVAP